MPMAKPTTPLSALPTWGNKAVGYGFEQSRSAAGAWPLVLVAHQRILRVRSTAHP